MKRRSNGGNTRLRSEHLKEERNESTEEMKKSSGGGGKVSVASLAIFQRITELPLAFRSVSADNDEDGGS